MIKVIILAAGIGSRLSSLTITQPKPLIRIYGIPIIEYQIKSYLDAGIDEKSIYIIAGYKYDIIYNYVKKNHPDINIINNSKYETTNNMYSLYLALSYILTHSSNNILISNGDCIYDPSIICELVNHKESLLVACDMSCYDRESMKITVDDCHISGISKLIPPEKAYAVSIDIYKLDSNSVKELKDIIESYMYVKKKLDLWTEVALNDLFKTSKFKPMDISGRKWVEIDTLSDLADADLMLSKLKLETKKCYILDLDGTTYLDGKPIDGTIKFIREAMRSGIDLYFFTNNTSKLPIDYVSILSRFKIDIKEDKIITPLSSLVKYIKLNKINSAYILANERVLNYLVKTTNIELCNQIESCQALILTYDTEINYNKLCKACILLQNKKILYLATHNDLVCPTPSGNIPDIGCIVIIIGKTTGKYPDVFFGKPNGSLLKDIIKYNNNDIVIVGDRLYTDKKLADNLGYDFICVLSGETKRESIDDLPADEYPDLIVNDLEVLLNV